VGALLWGDSVTRYALRISARNVRGTVQIPVETLNSAKSLAEVWFRQLNGLPERGGALFRDGAWKVEIVDNEGVTQWTL